MWDTLPQYTKNLTSEVCFPHFFHEIWTMGGSVIYMSFTNNLNQRTDLLNAQMGRWNLSFFFFFYSFTLSLFKSHATQSTRTTHTWESSWDKPSANGTTIKALSTNTVFVRCWDTPTDSGSWNFTKHTRDVTGIGESSGGNNFSSSMVPRKPNSVLICSDVVLGDTFVTWTTFVV